VAVCTQTGLRANPFCPEVETRTFAADDVPGVCTAHGQAEQSATVTVNVCVQTGLLATPNCPATEQATFPRDAVPGACTLHTER
jgi:hypothetical protein